MAQAGLKRYESPVRASEPEITFRDYDHIAPGEYVAYCQEARIYRDQRLGGSFTCLLLWDVLDGDLVTAKARVRSWLRLAAVNGKAHVRRGSKFWNWWVQANGGNPPKRGDRMTPRIFTRRMARVEIGDSQRPPSKKNETAPPYTPYSVVVAVHSWETGIR